MFETYALVSLLVGAFSLSILLYVAYRQIKESIRPRDLLTGLRFLILSVLLLSIFSATPSMAYRYIRATGRENQTLRNVATVTNTISQLGTATLLLMIFNYRIRDKGE